MHLFKKITVDLWLVYLLIIFLFIGLIFYGGLVRHHIINSVSRIPFFSTPAYFLASIPSNFKRIIEGQHSDLKTKEQRYENIIGFSGDTNQEKAYILLPRYDGNIKKSIVELIDLRSFEVLKKWQPKINEINKLVGESSPTYKTINKDFNSNRYLIYHPYLSDDGGLIFSGNYSPLIKIDQDSQLLWQNDSIVFHHSIESDFEGNLWAPGVANSPLIDTKYVSPESTNFKDDILVKFSDKGKILYKKSIINILIENGFENLLFQPIEGKFIFINDPIHINDIQPVLNDGDYWKKGDLFLSLRHKSMLLLYRPSTNKILWHSINHSSGQHDIQILDDHTISFFDNNTKSYFSGDKVEGVNKFIIYDFKKDTYTSYLDAAIKKSNIRTITDGKGMIFEDGSLFLQEHNYGRLIYFNSDGSTKWEYVNRADDGFVYQLRWARIFNSPEELKKIDKILNDGKK